MICNRFFSGIIPTLMFLFTSQVNAQETKAVFFSENGASFSIYMNGQLMNDYPMNQVKVNNLILKDYQFKLVWQDIALPNIETILKVKSGRENVYVIYEDKGKMEVDLYAKAKKGMYSPVTSVPPAQRNGYEGSLGCRKALSNTDFESKLIEFNNLDYPADRISFVRRSLQDNCITVKQLKQLLAKVDYESDKVELAKFGYSYIFDRDNYSSLADLFEYPGAYDEIQSYIKKQLNN